MRIFSNIFLTIFILHLFGIQKSASGSIGDKNEVNIDTNLVDDYDNNEEEFNEMDQSVGRNQRTKGIRNFVGTNLFGDCDGTRKKCFSSEDVALLGARRDFESLIPKDLPKCLVDDDIARLLMLYFYEANQIVDKMTRGHSRTVAQRAFYDTLGGYLKYYIVPISKYSFYAGLIKLKTVHSILLLYSESKQFLNTYGNGWREPLTDFTDLDIQIDPLKIVVDCEEEDTSCAQLHLSCDEGGGDGSNMIVALPHLDVEENGYLRNIWLPLKRKQTFDLQSKKSSYVLLRYFELTMRCYRYQKANPSYFHKQFKEWLMENIEIHVKDDVLYPGLGAVLRIMETLRRKRNGPLIVVDKANNKQERSQQSKIAKQLDDEDNDDSMRNLFTSLQSITSYGFHRPKYFAETSTKYIYIAAGVSLLLVLIVFLAIGVILYKKKPWNETTSEGEPPRENGTSQEQCKAEDKQQLLPPEKEEPKNKNKSRRNSNSAPPPPPPPQQQPEQQQQQQQPPPPTQPPPKVKQKKPTSKKKFCGLCTKSKDFRTSESSSDDAKNENKTCPAPTTKPKITFEDEKLDSKKNNNKPEETKETKPEKKTGILRKKSH